MKNIVALLLLLPFLSFAAPNDVVVTQRNSTDTGLAPNRLVAAPTDGSNVIMGFNGTTFLPVHWKVGTGLSITSGFLNATPADWNTLTNKPVLFNGVYSSLSGIPSTFAPSAHTHSAADIVSGTMLLARMPVLPISQTTGLQIALDGKFNVPTGTVNQYIRGNGSLATFPSIPPEQVSADWNASSGVSQILNKPELFSGNYADLSNKPVIPAAQVQTDWNATTGVSAILNKPTLFSGSYADLTGKPVLFDGAWSSLTGKPTTLAGYGITDSVTQTALTSALSGYATSTSLTSGLAGKFNTPTGITAQYLRGDGSLATFPTLPVGTVTSITAGTGLAGGTITGSGTISLPNTGTAGSYGIVTTDAQGRVTGGRNKTFTYPTRTLNTAYQVSATQDAFVNYTVDISVTSLLLAGTSGRVYLDYADNAAMSTNLVTVNESPNGTSGVLNITNIGPGNISGWIPAGKYVRIRTVNISNNPVFTYVRGQEVLE